ncbi:Protein of unknown function (DUF1685) [Melia azedarach]|uniref:Uncharacterized protein n=1 Tax=Melia azedarach TaxID=155640 RepID=A0ACC1Y1B0_MELAZ|nr:Protein of unknown function (DUF1685) [Melia azedarach]
MSKPNAPPPPRPLYKQHSWSPDAERDEAWQRRKGNYHVRRQRSKSVTDEDLQELKGFIELGFGFKPDSPELDPKLSDTLPALGLYCAVNKQYNNRLSRSSSTSSIFSDSDSGSGSSIIDPGDDPDMVKTRLRQWAQVVACSVRQISGEPN